MKRFSLYKVVIHVHPSRTGFTSTAQPLCLCVSFSFHPGTAPSSKCILQLLISGSLPGEELRSSSTLFYSPLKYLTSLSNSACIFHLHSWAAAEHLWRRSHVLARHYHLFSYDHSKMTYSEKNSHFLSCLNNVLNVPLFALRIILTFVYLQVLLFHVYKVSRRDPPHPAHAHLFPLMRVISRLSCERNSSSVLFQLVQLWIRIDFTHWIDLFASPASFTAYSLHTEMCTKKYNTGPALKQSPPLLIYEMQKTSM